MMFDTDEVINAVTAGIRVVSDFYDGDERKTQAELGSIRGHRLSIEMRRTHSGNVSIVGSGVWVDYDEASWSSGVESSGPEGCVLCILSAVERAIEQGPRSK